MKEATPRRLTMLALKEAKKEFIIRFLTALVSRGLLMVIPVLFGFAVDNISKGNYQGAYTLAIILVFVFIAFRIFDVINTYAWHKLYNKLYQSLTNVGLQNTNDNSLFSLSRINTGEYINIMNNDVNIMSDFYCHLPLRIIRVIEFIVIFIYFFIINFFIGLAGVVVSVIAFTVIFISSNTIEKLNKKRAFELDHKSGILLEILLCIKEIKGFNIFKPIKERAMNSSDNFVKAWLKQRVVEDTYRFGIVLLIEVFRLGLFIYGIYLITQGQMELGSLLVIYNYYAHLIDNFNDFATINIGYRNLIVSENRFNKILEFSSKDVKKKAKEIDCKGDITFRNILYGYKDAPTLRNVSFTAKAGEITCIAGEASSGKTGIVDLLLKLNRQHEGEILLDETNINEYDTNDYLALISLTSDDSALFNVSIRENLSIIDEDFERIIDICKILDIHDYIINLKDGYDTVLTSNASNIDLNVKILLGVIRAIIKDAKIFIFDEVFNLLDKKSIDSLMKILHNNKENHTIIIITKDRNILEQADNIVVITNHEVAGSGTHEELLNNEKYQDIVAK